MHRRWSKVTCAPGKHVLRLGQWQCHQPIVGSLLRKDFTYCMCLCLSIETNSKRKRHTRWGSDFSKESTCSTSVGAGQLHRNLYCIYIYTRKYGPQPETQHSSHHLIQRLIYTPLKGPTSFCFGGLIPSVLTRAGSCTAVAWGCMAWGIASPRSSSSRRCVTRCRIPYF